MSGATDVWIAVDKLRPGGINRREWKQSYVGVSAAIEHIGYAMVMNNEQFNALEIPKNKAGRQCWSERKIIVSRNDVISTPTTIKSLISGNSRLQTPLERIIMNRKKSEKGSKHKGKGLCSTHRTEAQALQDVIEVCDIESCMITVSTFEHRLADVGYCFLNEDQTSQVFAADQVKTARVTERGLLGFGHHGHTITIGDMRSILQNGMSLTMIGLNEGGKPDVVWLFDQIEGKNVLEPFPENQYFNMRLHLEVPSYHPVTVACNNPRFRFDIGSSIGEIIRFRNRRLEINKSAPKFSLKFLNEDDSQIPSPTHRIEHQSFLMTRKACAKQNVAIEHLLEDSYGPIDFRMNKTIRIQDKVGEKRIRMRTKGRYPYDPDSFDIFQITNLKDSTLYVIPTRVFHDGIVSSYFSQDELMSTITYFSEDWKAKHAKFKYNFKDDSNVTRYIEACKDAYNIPKLTNRRFYEDMLNQNRSKFGSKKRLASFSEA